MIKHLPQGIIFLLLVTFYDAKAQTKWPKKITTTNGAVITMYQPTPETFADNHVNFRSAISIEPKPKADLIFGAIWADAKVNTDRETRMVSLESVKVKNVRFPDLTDTSKIEKLKKILETEIPKWKLTVSLDELIAMVENVNPKVSEGLKNDPPKVIFKEENSTLITIDGEPKVEMDNNIKMNKVKNTPFLIIQNDDKYYLYAGKYWYKSKSITEGWEVTDKLPSDIAELDKQMKAKQTPEQKAVGEQFKTPPAIVVSTVPTELICSDGKANLQPIDSTNLLYVANSDNNIFMDITSQMYFTLLSGRWYRAKTLEGPYEYVDPEKIPSDFARIPEGHEKDIVLASVPGTAAAKEAVMDAQIPQTAKVDRKTATTEVKFDGEPKYEKIEGTNMEVAKNTSSTVIKDKDKYYAVKDGIWFMGVLATGGLLGLATERPSEVEKIPPSSSVYNTKYVEIYEVTDDYVYVGYTPGYMGAYVAGPVVVYGTGYYYDPWFGPYYYPHPVTYGYGMAYNPYYGWSMGFAFSVGFFAGAAWGHYGGYWGCGGYHPPYHGHYGHGGYYGHGGNHVNHYGNTNINIDRSNNVYRGQNGVNTNDIKRGQGNTRPSAGQQPAGGNRGDRGPSAGQQPAGGDRGDRGPSAGQQPVGGNKGDRPSSGQQPAAGGTKDRPSAGQQPAGGNQSGRPSASQQPANNNVRTDRDGNVYKQGNDGNWQQRSNNGWENSNRSSSGASQMDRQQQNSNRGQTRSSNYGSGMGGGGNRSYSGGGGSRGGMSRGGGGGRR